MPNFIECLGDIKCNSSILAHLHPTRLESMKTIPKVSEKASDAKMFTQTNRRLKDLTNNRKKAYRMTLT